ncbi:MAG: hypothetical protein GXP08_05335 [Gammaproteobacteria bacterium]|nr:hypothetical protein [Gammaproteobacteria bacterium]
MAKLVVSFDSLGDEDIKHSISNASSTTSTHRLYMQEQRHYILSLSDIISSIILGRFRRGFFISG